MDPDPSFRFNADPDLTFKLNADLDPDPAPHESSLHASFVSLKALEFLV